MSIGTILSIAYSLQKPGRNLKTPLIALDYDENGPYKTCRAR